MMHRTLVVLAAAFFLGDLASLAACSSTTNGNPFPAPAQTVYASPDGANSLTPLSGSASGASANGASASGPPGAGVAALIKGSALCNASPASGCFPDEAPTGRDCDVALDGGADDAAANESDGGALGCRVVSDGGVPTAPRATCLVAGPGVDGASCRISSDCAPTDECVGSGACRRYCCGDPCDPQHFCDVQPETQNPALVVPVCMPVRRCALLAPPADGGACDTTETCTPVLASNGMGLTTCIPLGPAHEGDSCEAQHCAGNLACIGMWGSKQCVKLCHTADAGTPECGPEQTCTGGLPLFTDPSIGLCQQLALPVGPDR